jgi:CheY-like chemotaxis protein
MVTDQKNTVIVLDDEDMVRELVSELTSHMRGYNPIPVKSGIEALSAYRHAADDIAYIITDYNLKGENGVDAVKALRQEGYKGPVIFMTGRPLDLDDHLERERESIGTHATLSKPFMFSEYKSLVSRLME